MSKKLSKAAFTILAGFGFIMAWIIFIQFTKTFLLFETPIGAFETAAGTFILACVVTPLWEELIFRYVPMELVTKVNAYTKQDYTWIAILLSSYFFGSGHEGGIFAIMLQGVCGVVLCLVYLYNGRSYWSSVIVHAMWNITVLYVWPIFSN